MKVISPFGRSPPPLVGDVIFGWRQSVVGLLDGAGCDEVKNIY